jgi:hypothetical protein
MSAQGLAANRNNLEVVMATTEYVLDSLAEMDRFVGLMATATGADGIVAAIHEYLAGWTRERVLRLQTIDAGWAPFDERQQPVPVYGAFDALQICDSVRGQCIALKETGITLAPELLELDLFFFFVRQVIEDHEPAASRAYAAVLRTRHGGRRQPSANQAAGARF